MSTRTIRWITSDTYVTNDSLSLERIRVFQNMPDGTHVQISDHDFRLNGGISPVVFENGNLAITQVDLQDAVADALAPLNSQLSATNYNVNKIEVVHVDNDNLIYNSDIEKVREAWTTNALEISISFIYRGSNPNRLYNGFNQKVIGQTL